MGYHYRARYEFVLFFEKGKRRLNDLSISDVLEFKRVRNGYPAEKPLELIQTLIMQSSEADELVLDPFFGSGTTMLASRRLGRAVWGTDTAHRAHQAAAERLAAEGYYEGASPSADQTNFLRQGLTGTCSRKAEAGLQASGTIIEVRTARVHPSAVSVPGTASLTGEEEDSSE